MDGLFRWDFFFFFVRSSEWLVDKLVDRYAGYQVIHQLKFFFEIISSNVEMGKRGGRAAEIRGQTMIETS